MAKNKKVTVSLYGTRKEKIYTLITVKSYMRKGKRVKGYDTFRPTTKTYSTRFNFTGTPQQLKQAIALAKRRGWTPRKRFQTVKAQNYIRNPQKYESRDKWTKKVSKIGYF